MFLHVSVTYSFLLWNSSPLYKYSTVYPFYWWIFGLSGCLAIVNKAVTRFLYKSFYKHVFSFLLGKSVGVQLMGHRIGLFHFTRNEQTFFELLMTFSLGFKNDHIDYNVGRIQGMIIEMGSQYFVLA